MEISNLKELLVDELKDIYSAENQLLKALPKMAKKATHPELKEAIESHLVETQGHVQRLDEVFSTLGEKATGQTCQAMKGLLTEAKEMMDKDMDDDSMDAAIIACGQKVEHYEIASYGTVRAWAKVLKETEMVTTLSKTLEEEGAADKKLSKLAVSSINLQSAEEHDDEDEEMAAAGNGKAGKRGKSK